MRKAGRDATKETSLTSAASMPKKPCNPFTHKEKLAILQYIIRNKAFNFVKGNTLWKDMQVNFPKHTWQSLKEHYKKQLYPRLKSSGVFGLSEDEINMFRLGNQPAVVLKERRQGSRSPSPPTDFYSLLSDDEDAVPTGSDAMETVVQVEGSSEATKNEHPSTCFVTIRSKRPNGLQPPSLKPVGALASSGSAATVAERPGKKLSDVQVGEKPGTSSDSSFSHSCNKTREIEADVSYDVSSGSDSDVVEEMACKLEGSKYISRGSSWRPEARAHCKFSPSCVV